MKKLLVGTAVVALGFGLSAPAQAAKDGIKLGLGGSFAGYVSWVDQDESTGNDVRSVSILRETEIHMTGETTLDNGLTVGMHFEMEADGGTATSDTFDVEESYAYFSGAWGRVNFGSEDGAAFLLQVSAPGADSNIDGVRQQVQPANLAATDVGAAVTILNAFGTGTASVNDLNTRFDYDNNPARFDNKLTYMTPVFNGFQFGVSYTPDLGTGQNSLAGNPLGDQTDDYGAVWEAAGRYEGNLGDVGVALGGGYTNTNLEDEDLALGDLGVLDDNSRWNVGIDLNWGAFGLGAAYLENDHGWDRDGDETVWVVGVDYTTGPYKLGASYYDNSQELDGILDTDSSGDFDTDRWMAGVTYTYGPGMTFRGSVGVANYEAPAALMAPFSNDEDATFVMLGTQINF